MASLLQSRPVLAIRGIASDWGKLNLGDGAAALTYFAILSIFPGLIVFLSIIGLIGDEGTADSILRIINDLAPGSAADTFEGATRSIVTGDDAGVALVFGLVAALYSASGYIGAFSRTANRVYGIEETRPFWRNLPRQFVLALVLMVLLAFAMLALVLTGPLLQSISDEAGIGDGVVDAFKIIKWPLLAVVVIFMFALLQYVGPNVDHDRFRTLLPGSFLALGIWLIASLGFSFYVSNFGKYASTYGSLAGVIIFLVWLWLSNLAVLLGTAFNAKLEEERLSDPASPTRPMEHGKELAGE